MKKYTSFLVVFILLFSFGAFFYNTNKAKAAGCIFSASPSNATVAVGQSVKFTITWNANDPACALIGQSTSIGKIATPNDAEWGVFDPFYFKRDEANHTPGVFVAVNPGNTEIIYRDYAGDVHIPVTITGTASSSSGSIKISDSKILSSKMFPQASLLCSPRANGCTRPLTTLSGLSDESGREQDVLKVYDQAKVPGLVMNVYDWKYSNSGENISESGPDYFDITVPMSPTLVSSLSSHRDAGGMGDNGGMSSTEASGFSNDLNYVGLLVKTGFPIAWVNGAGPFITNVGKGSTFYGSQILFAQHGGNTYEISPNDYKNVTGLSSDFKPADSPSIPASFPALPNGTKEVLTGDDYVAVLPAPKQISTLDSNKQPMPTKISVYSLDKKTAVSTVSLPSVYGESTTNWTQLNLVRMPATGADYLFVYSSVPGVSGKSVTQQQLYNLDTLLSVYKFTFEGEKLEKVVSGVKIGGGRLGALAGILVSEHPAVMTFTSMHSAFNGNFPTLVSRQAHVYMLSDLAAGKVQDILANSYVAKHYCFDSKTCSINASGENVKTAVSYVKGDSTYVYVVGDAGVRAMKLDYTGFSSKEVKDEQKPLSADCAPGDKYSRLTGKLCAAETQTNDCAEGDLFSTLTGKACSQN